MCLGLKGADGGHDGSISDCPDSEIRHVIARSGSDEAIPRRMAKLAGDCFAPLAMTGFRNISELLIWDTRRMPDCSVTWASA